MHIKDPLIDPCRKVLYRNFHEIETKFKIVYLVEISRNKNKFFILLFPNYEQPEMFLNQILSYKIGEKLLSLVNNNLIKFIKTFDIKFGKLVLENYHFGFVYQELLTRVLEESTAIK
jgi:hypothetical protein